MKKTFKKITSFLLVLTMVVVQLLPSIKVFADEIITETGLAVQIKDPTTLEFVNVGNSYVFNNSYVNLTNYELNITTNNYELENTNYLLVLENEVYTINYEDKISSNSIRKVLTKDILGKVSTSINLDALTFNGKMPVSLKLYDISDIYDDFVIGGGDVDAIDLTGKTAMLTKTFDIFSTGYTNDVKLGSVTYNNVSDVLYNSVNGYYEVDALQSLVNAVKVNFNTILGNADILEKYYLHYSLNDYFFGFDDVNLSTSTIKDLTILNNLTNGLYDFKIIVTDVNGNEITRNNVKFSLTNSSKILTKEDLTGETVLLENIISYNNMSEEEKNTLGLTDVEISELKDKEKVYSSNSYFETILNNVLSSAVVELNSYNKINNEEISTLFTKGTIDHLEALDNRMTINSLLGLFNDDMLGDMVINTYLEDGTKVGNDTYLKTNMTVEIIINGYKFNYKVAILGNLVSNDGYIKHDDIVNIIDIAINSSDLSNIYHLVSDINYDGKIDILDVTNLMNLLKNGGIPFTSRENPIASNIQATLNPDKTEVRVGDEFELTLMVKNFGNNKISGLEGIINYDEELVEVLSVLNINDWYGNINVINDNLAGKFLTSGYTELNDNTAVVTYTFRALKEGTARVYVDSLKAALNGVEVTLTSTTTNTVEVNVDRALSSNNNISNIEFNTGKLDKEFDHNILTYTLYVGYYTNSINISGLLEDANATTSAFKDYTLTGYKTTIELPVVAEDGSVKTYVITVIKVDNRSSNNYLSDIDIEGVDLSFDKNSLEYNITVLNDITELTVIAVAEDENAEVTITGNTNLKVGMNVIGIKVRAENGQVRTYKINVEREEKVEVLDKDNDNNTKLILIILIVATIAALAFLIFKDNEPKEKEDFKLKDRPYNRK